MICHRCHRASTLQRGAHLPHADVHVVAAGEDIGGVAREAHREDSLHALCVVHLDLIRDSVRHDEHSRASVAS
jgi:hypothetical protein